MVIQHPWQNGPAELIEFAIRHLHRGTDFDQRIAFLLLDIGVETLFKTFLTLPSEVTKAQGSFHERQEAAEGNFHELVRGLDKAAGAKLRGYDLSHVQFYHELRNKLYHQGNGITIPTNKAREYARLAVDLLKVLLDVDLSDELTKPETILQEQTRIQELAAEMNSQKIAVRKSLARLDSDIAATLERIEPRLVLPSFARQFASISSEYEEVEWDWDGNEGVVLTRDKSKRLEYGKRILDLLDSMIANPTVKSQLFTKIPLEGEAKAFLGIDMRIEAAAMPLLGERIADISSVFRRILEILVADGVEQLEHSYQGAYGYPENVYFDEQSETSEEFLSKAIAEGRQQLQTLHRIRIVLQEWMNMC